MIEEQQLKLAHSLLAARVSDRPRGEDPDRPETVQAMQIALHIPKATPPRRDELLEAAAIAVVKVCLDPRVSTDPEFRSGLENWYDHLIRKVTRRARNKNWEVAQTVPGVTVEVGSAQARAFLPSAVSEVPPELRKLQISGTELPESESRELPVEGGELPRVYIDAGLAMTTGKAAAQVGHASMLLAANQNFEWVRRWAEHDFALHVLEIDSVLFHTLAQAPEAVAVHDAGFTEVAPDSMTVFALPGRI
ncbi:aminoacyl-tRNA hydrolase [Corynebacterium sp. A21]|uniref:aminoacyl-tRNA hydrolase n=1 Tax=Corynebacterium sp. A21 TaxID=3457318 RepID=UPI003FCFB9A7